MTVDLSAIIEWSPTTAPLAATPVWQSITADVRSFRIDRQLGREGTCELVVDNRDRDWEPEYAASAWYPNVLPNRRLRVRKSWGNLLNAGTADVSVSDPAGDLVAGYSPSFGTLDTATVAGETVRRFTASGAGQNIWNIDKDDGHVVPVVGGTTVTFVVDVRSAATVRSWTIGYGFYDASGTLVSAGGSSTLGTSTTTGWTQLAYQRPVPASAVMAEMFVATTANVAAAEVHYARRFGVLEGTSTTWVQGTQVVYDGFIDSIAPRYQVGGDALVSIGCSDLTKFLARYKLEVPYEREVAADAPVHWWKMGEGRGEMSLADSGSSPVAGVATGGAPQLGESPTALATSRTAFRVDWQDPTIITYAVPEAGWPAFTLEFLVRNIETQKTSGTVNGSCVLQAFGGSGFWLEIEVAATYASAATSGGIILHLSDPLWGTTAAYDTGLDESALHHWAITFNAGNFATYVDGVQLDVFTAVSTSFILGRLRTGAAASSGADAAAVISDLAWYASALSPARVAAHAAAALAPWEGDTPGDRIGRLNGLAGIPSALRNLDAGVTGALGPVYEPVEGVTALDHARLVEATEQGRMFADRGGRWTFQARRADFGATSAATFGDATGEVPYAELEQTYDEEGLVNRATVTRQGGNPQTYEDAASEADHGIFSIDRAGVLYATDVEAYDAATYAVVRNKDPKLRFRRLTLHAHRSDTVMDACVVRDLGDVITVRRRPPGGGAAQEKTLVIEAVAHEVDWSAQRWVATFQLAPADTGPYWVLEDASFGQLDSTAVLAF